MVPEYKEAAVTREEDRCERYGNEDDATSPGTCQVFVDVCVHECVLEKARTDHPPGAGWAICASCSFRIRLDRAALYGGLDALRNPQRGGKYGLSLCITAIHGRTF